MATIWETAETYDIVCAAIAIIFIIFTLIILSHSAIISIKEKKKGKGIPSEEGRKDRVHQIQNPDDTGFGYTGTRQNLGARSRRKHQDRTD